MVRYLHEEAAQMDLDALPYEDQDRVRLLLEGILAGRMLAIGCLAVRRYSAAIQIAEDNGIDNQDSRKAADRLRAYGAARVAECTSQTPAGKRGKGEKEKKGDVPG